MINLGSYVSTRHIIEWRIRLSNGALQDIKSRNIERSAFAYQGEPGVALFTNQVRLVQPPWHGQRVADENGRVSVKRHHVGLVWRDVVLNSADSRDYEFYNLIPDLGFNIAANQVERLGRLPSKAEVENGTPLNSVVAAESPTTAPAQDPRRTPQQPVVTPAPQPAGRSGGILGRVFGRPRR